MRRRLRILPTVMMAALAPSACSRNPVTSMVRGYDAGVDQGVRALRAATLPFQTIDSAAAVGYTRQVQDCLVHEHHGAMGYHHTNPRLMDAKVEVDKPEILLYERLPNGDYRLNGVEFIVPFRAWPRDSVAPTVMGQTMHREDNLNFWYLHVWSWKQNPDGLFANFHPAVQCPSAARKVFKPSGT
jgi:hypothetical protein